jgi:hypothetical protein
MTLERHERSLLRGLLPACRLGAYLIAGKRLVQWGREQVVGVVAQGLGGNSQHNAEDMALRIAMGKESFGAFPGGVPRLDTIKQRPGGRPGHLAILFLPSPQ